MNIYTENEETYLKRIKERLTKLKSFLNTLNLEDDSELTDWYEGLSEIKTIQGNSNNDVSFIACVMAKGYLAKKFRIGTFDVAEKPQGANGLDIDLLTEGGERVVGEIKTTTPYSGAKNDFGAKQKESFKHDFDKLNNIPADHKFFFLTDSKSFELVQKKYAKLIANVNVVLLTPQIKKRHFGSAKGLITIADDFDEPLADFNEYMK